LAREQLVAGFAGRGESGPEHFDWKDEPMTDERKPTGTLTFEDGRGRPQSRPINFTLDVRDFEGTAGEAHAVIAANRHLSVGDLRLLLSSFGIERPRSWIHRRRWMYQDPETTNEVGAKPNADGKDERARAIIRDKDNSRMSARQLVHLLREHGIPRGRDWVWKNRGRTTL
jgi:hypothetical protein